MVSKYIIESEIYSLRITLFKFKLNGANFDDWSRTLRYLLKLQGQEYVLSTKIPTKPKIDANELELRAFKAQLKDALEVQSLMVSTMEPDLEDRFAFVAPHEIFCTLEAMFQKSSRQERYDVHCTLLDCKLSIDQQASPHVIRMINLLERLETLGTPVPREVAVDIILRSLPRPFTSFVMEFYMFSFDNSLSELHARITKAEIKFRESEGSIPSCSSSNLVIQKRKTLKGKRKGKAKTGSLTPVIAQSSVGSS